VRFPPSALRSTASEWSDGVRQTWPRFRRSTSTPSIRSNACVPQLGPSIQLVARVRAVDAAPGRTRPLGRLRRHAVDFLRECGTKSQPVDGEEPGRPAHALSLCESVSPTSAGPLTHGLNPGLAEQLLIVRIENSGRLTWCFGPAEGHVDDLDDRPAGGASRRPAGEEQRLLTSWSPSGSWPVRCRRAEGTPACQLVWASRAPTVASRGCSGRASARAMATRAHAPTAPWEALSKATSP